MRDVHVALGWSVVIAFGALFLWGLGAFVARRAPGRLFWRLVAFVQVAVLVQAIAGIVLIVAGARASALHYVYGAIFPVLVLMVAHVVARDAFAHRPWAPFALAAFFCFGLTLRALMTGSGVP